MDPVVDEDEASEAEEERHWVTGIGWKPGPAPAKTASRAERMAISPSSPTSAKNCSDYVPRTSSGRFECPAGCGRAFDHAPAAAAHGKACNGEDDGRRRSPVQRGDNKRFPCPAGCARTFDHAPAAAAHGKTCSGSSVIPDDDWAATARSLLREIRGERERNRYANLEELRPALTRCGFSGTPPPWRAGYCGVSTPANFPESSRIRSLAQLVNYLEGALSKGGKAPPKEVVQEESDDVDDQFAAMSSSQLRSAMQSRGIGRGAYDTPVDFRRKLRAYEAKRPRSSDDDDRGVKRAKTDDSSSRFTGVSHDKRNGKWYASMCHRGAKEQLGAFDEEDDAARAHDEARVRYGKKAVNFPSSSSDDEAEFSVGARVEVRWRKKWYPAVIDAIYDGGGSYEVEWIGDGRFNRVTANSVRAVPASPRSVVEKRGRASSEFCDSDDEVMPAKKVRGSPEGTEKLKAEPLIEQEFDLGVRVEAKWNGRYYPASVHRFDKGRYEVMWDDDEGYNWVPAKALRAAK